MGGRARPSEDRRDVHLRQRAVVWTGRRGQADGRRARGLDRGDQETQRDDRGRRALRILDPADPRRRDGGPPRRRLTLLSAPYGIARIYAGDSGRRWSAAELREDPAPLIC